MADVKLGNNTYTGVTAVKLDTTDGGSVLFAEESVLVEDCLASILNKEITELINSKATGGVCPGFQKGNKNLIKVNLPNVTELGESAFTSCSNLTEVNLPGVTSMVAAAFGNTGLTSIYMPSLETITGWGYDFNTCQRLQKAYFPKLINIGNSCFNSCSSLTALILGSDSVCELGNTNAFSNSPILAGTGYVYVPSALADRYREATNWSVYAEQIRAIEDYPEILEGWE